MRRCACVVVAVCGLVAASPAGAVFPGKNGELVFSGVDAVSKTVQVYRIAPSGGTPTELTTPDPSRAVTNECPSWSADGRLIYFDKFDRSTNLTLIYHLSATGGLPTLADSPDAPTHLCPTVNRSGTRIAAMQYAKDGSEGIVRMNTDGSDRQIVAGAGPKQDNYGPQFAPTGSRILFNKVTYNGEAVERSDLLIVNGAGQGKEHHSQEQRAVLRTLVVSPRQYDSRCSRGNARRDRPDERGWQSRPRPCQGAGRWAVESHVLPRR